MTKTYQITRRVTDREVATLLAALRVAQNHHAELVKMPHFAGLAPLTIEEIDELCETINLGEDYLKEVIQEDEEANNG